MSCAVHGCKDKFALKNLSQCPQIVFWHSEHLRGIAEECSPVTRRSLGQHRAALTVYSAFSGHPRREASVLRSERQKGLVGRQVSLLLCSEHENFGRALMPILCGLEALQENPLQGEFLDPFEPVTVLGSSHVQSSRSAYIAYIVTHWIRTSRW